MQDVLYWGLKASPVAWTNLNCDFWSKKILKNSNCNFFRHFLVIKTLGPDPDWIRINLKFWIWDRIQWIRIHSTEEKVSILSYKNNSGFGFHFPLSVTVSFRQAESPPPPSPSIVMSLSSMTCEGRQSYHIKCLKGLCHKMNIFYVYNNTGT